MAAVSKSNEQLAALTDQNATLQKENAGLIATNEQFKERYELAEKSIATMQKELIALAKKENKK